MRSNAIVSRSSKSSALQNILDDMPVNKLLAFADPRRIMSLRWQLNMQLNGAIRLVQSNVPGMLEIPAARRFQRRYAARPAEANGHPGS
jgi:hypothetical protein